MFFTKKFYEADATVAEPPTDTPPVSLAELAAKSGRLVMPSDDGPARVIERQQKPSTEPQPSPAHATEAARSSEPATQESQKPTEQTSTATAQTEQAESQGSSWQEVLKQQQPDTILNGLGYGEQLVKFLNGRKNIDAKMLNFIDHWEKSNGDVKPYLNALSTDFAKMPPEEVMRHHLREQYPELEPKQLDRLYKLKVVDRYKLDPQNYSEEEVADGQIELLADVKPIRNQLMQSQSDFLLPKPEPKTVEADHQAAQRQQDFEAYQSRLVENQYTKKLFETKKFSFGEGEDRFSTDVDPQEIVDTLLDPSKWVGNFYTAVKHPDGSVEYQPDYEKQLLIATFAKDPKGFLNNFAKHFKSIGGKTAIAPIENAKPPTDATPAAAEQEGTNPAAVMAKRGKVVHGSDS